MAKGDPNSVTVQYKVHLKPTAIGRLVIERLARPHVDVSPELRRFIELGYAAERAGFILDGTVLRHAGRAWDTQPDVSDQTQAKAGLDDEKPAVRPQRAQAQRSAKPAPGTAGSDGDQLKPDPPVDGAGDASTTPGSLRGRLRGLSG